MSLQLKRIFFELCCRLSRLLHGEEGNERLRLCAGVKVSKLWLCCRGGVLVVFEEN